MDRDRFEKSALIVGGGAAGMLAALTLARRGASVTVLERNDRAGRKLSATGNGQGNITNRDMGAHRYFASEPKKVEAVLSAFGKEELCRLLTSLGGYFTEDEEGRIYPASRQASSVTDLLRFALAKEGVRVHTGEYVRAAQKERGGFRVLTEKGDYFSRFLLIAAGGMASPHFGSDGNGYALARAFGHSVTPLSPALVQLKTDRGGVRGLKGVRIDCGVRLERGGAEVFACRGDVIFTDYGVSGNAVFKTSSYAKAGDTLVIDLLPCCEEETLSRLLLQKTAAYPALPAEDLLRCIVNSAAAKCVLRSLSVAAAQPCKELGGRCRAIAHKVKNYPLRIEGDMGFANAQVTKGGVPLFEVDGHMMSKKVHGLFFAGEILDVDGECGGYNLQWAFSSGVCAAERMAELIDEDR